MEIGSHARKSNKGLYTVQSGNRNELTLEEVTRAARRLGFGLRPWIVRQQNYRGFSTTAPGRNQNSGEQQQSPKFNQSGNGSARTQNPIRRQTPVGDVKCWTCGKTGHYASDCKSSGPKFAFAPKALKMNFLQQIADQVQEYSEEEQNPRSGKRIVPCVETHTSRHKDLDHHSHQPSSSSPRNTVCVLSDHQPANHQEFELSVIGEISDGIAVKTGNSKGYCAQDIMSVPEDARTHRISSESDTVMSEEKNEHCAQDIITEFEDARTQKISSESNTVVIEAEIHAENTDAQHIVHFEEAQDFSDAGSLITQAPQSQSIHATINALSTWVSAIQPRESWYLAGWIGDSPIDFLVDPGAVVSAISLQSYEKLMESNAILTPMKAMHMELEAANKSDMRVHGICNLELSVHGLIINIDAVVVDLNCHAILGMDILGDASKLPFILDLVKGTLSGGGHETIQLHRFQAATECFAETTDSVCIPPHSEVMLWAKLKTNNGRKGPTAGVVLALQTFVQEFGLLVGRSLVRADADDWKIPILIYNSDPCTMKPADCTCNPVIIPGHTRIARVEEIQAIQHIGSRETDMNAAEGALPPHLIDVLDAATELTSDQRARAAALLAKHVNTFPAPGTPITGRTEAVTHDIDTGSTRPIPL